MTAAAHGEPHQPPDGTRAFAEKHAPNWRAR